MSAPARWLVLPREVSFSCGSFSFRPWEKMMFVVLPAPLVLLDMAALWNRMISCGMRYLTMVGLWILGIGGELMVDGCFVCGHIIVCFMVL